MGAASLPAGAGQGRADRGDQAGVGVGGDQPDPGQPGGQVLEERQPRGAGLGRSDLAAEDLPVPVAVDPGGHQHGRVDHAAALADLHRQGVGGHERVRAGVQRAGAEGLDLGIQVLGHLADLGPRQRGDAQELT